MMLALTLSLLVALAPALHPRLVRSEPAAGAMLAESPRELRLWFDGGAEPAFTQVALHASSGARLALGAPVADRAGGVVVPVPLALAPDTYRVSWQTVGRDGHPIQGAFAFTVSGAGSAGAQPPRATLDDSTAWGAGSAGRSVAGGRVVDPGSVEAVSTQGPTEQGGGTRPVRWAELSMLAAALGAIAMLLVVLPTDPGSPAHERFVAAATARARLLGIGTALLFLVATAVRFGLESDTMHGAESGITPEALARTAATAWGRAWCIGAVAALVMLLALLLRRRGTRPELLHRSSAGTDLLLAAAALVAALGPALTGHAAGAAALMPLAVFSDWLHVIGGSAWIGGVFALALAGAPAALAQPAADRAPALAWIVAAFHAVAAPAIALVTASGVLSAWLRVGSWEALMRTNYGDLLLFKVYVVAFAALLGAYHWLRVHPRLSSGGEAREASRMQWTLYLEALGGLVIIGLTAALVTTPPPR